MLQKDRKWLPKSESRQDVSFLEGMTNHVHLFLHLGPSDWRNRVKLLFGYLPMSKKFILILIMRSVICSVISGIPEHKYKYRQHR